MPASLSLLSPKDRQASWPAGAWIVLLAMLALATVVIHGFHPFAEDGGLYAAGIEYTLDRSLFPHDRAFVLAHLRFSEFAPLIALLVRVTHLSLAAALLLLDIVIAFFTMLAARSLLRRCVPNEPAQLAGLAMLAAGWTLPIAGTSLYLMDPYVTARSLCFPLALFAIAFALDPWRGTGKPKVSLSSALLCILCLLAAAALHPLMAFYAMLFVLAVRASGSTHPWKAWTLLAATLLFASGGAYGFAPAESPSETAAVLTRYYWFLSQWHWYERLGLLGPLLMLLLVLRMSRNDPDRPSSFRSLIHSSALLGLLCVVCALLFARESAPTHVLARLQPLRAFLLVYAVMLLLLGATLQRACMRAARLTSRAWRAGLRVLPILAPAGMAAGMFLAERATYPASPHVELPWKMAATRNGWTQAFLWVQGHTPPDALFALDARYVNNPGEDAQNFRALSLRSMVPDFSKDGGEASITPALAPAWLAGADAQKDLSTLTDAERDLRLQALGVTWMVLQASAHTAHSCPYGNATVRVCRLSLKQ